MSTTLVDRKGVNVTQFWGGNRRGVCYQLNAGGQFVQLTAAQLKVVLLDLAAVIRVAVAVKHAEKLNKK